MADLISSGSGLGPLRLTHGTSPAYFQAVEGLTPTIAPTAR